MTEVVIGTFDEAADSSLLRSVGEQGGSDTDALLGPESIGGLLEGMRLQMLSIRKMLPDNRPSDSTVPVQIPSHLSYGPQSDLDYFIIVDSMPPVNPEAGPLESRLAS